MLSFWLLLLLSGGCFTSVSFSLPFLSFAIYFFSLSLGMFLLFETPLFVSLTQLRLPILAPPLEACHYRPPRTVFVPSSIWVFSIVLCSLSFSLLSLSQHNKHTQKRFSKTLSL